MSQPTTCSKCNGSGVTGQVRYTVITKPDGSQEPVTETFTGPCSGCNGSGRTY
ncbi:hypothetical protein ACFYNO_26265 [Kitasatospora sp. NPDC006697]|uniref:hypothetical protein n=1 Tax=Kitasatospora sp. NPDC006697 TaxID=3364020 RepID=UPI00368E4292